jgi:hypothetical protein
VRDARVIADRVHVRLAIANAFREPLAVAQRVLELQLGAELVEEAQLPSPSRRLSALQRGEQSQRTAIVLAGFVVTGDKPTHLRR